MDDPSHSGPITPPRPLPPLAWVPSYAWINTAPINLGTWRGSPVLLDVWNIRCTHCISSLPWLKAVAQRHGPRGLKVLSIHTPEVPDDHAAQRVHQEVERLGVTEPVVMDNQYDYWRALGNRYWPTFYLADRLGQLRFRQVGRVQPGSAEAQRMESWIDELLNEPQVGDEQHRS